ncbi:Zinc finger MYND-type [Arabidopsis suecica]|uniref:Zinc finger MYND-type n=1 Tax=Arabidopsis suecica TaxID=45249 RepID=A0A8T2BY42_ARASU|nr:Zinc finger MYND-type [Arabidopsis suecica]
MINYLSQMEAEQALRSEAMAASSKVLRGKTVVAESGFLRAGTVDVTANWSFRVATVAAASGVPVMVRSKSKELHVCARCLSPAKTRCSRCKSIRYCSGDCQIIHWRLSHKDECVPAGYCFASPGKLSCDEESASLGGSQVEIAPQVQMQEKTVARFGETTPVKGEMFKVRSRI